MRNNKNKKLENEYNNQIKVKSKGKYIRIRTFLGDLLLDKNNHYLVKKLEKNCD